MASWNPADFDVKPYRMDKSALVMMNAEVHDEELKESARVVSSIAVQTHPSRHMKRPTTTISRTCQS